MYYKEKPFVIMEQNINVNNIAGNSFIFAQHTVLQVDPSLSANRQINLILKGALETLDTYCEWNGIANKVFRVSGYTNIGNFKIEPVGICRLNNGREIHLIAYKQNGLFNIIVE